MKHNCQREKYLTYINNNIFRRSVSKLRLGSHKLPIETDRYKGIPQNKRICNFCKTSIATEYHCLMECFHPTLSSKRNIFSYNIYKINNNFIKLSRKQLFKYLMAFSDVNTVNETAKYIHAILCLYE